MIEIYQIPKNIFLYILSFFLDIFFPKRCVGCGGYGGYLCASCARNLELCTTSVCIFCGKINKYGELCTSCKRKHKFELKGIIAAARYDSGPLREMIHHLKYSGFTEIAPLLAEMVFLRISNRLPKGKLEVVPVPLSKRREAGRGFNQSRLIARELADKLNLPGGDFLSRIKDTESQVGLSAKDRKKNVSSAFSCDAEEVSGKTILLIDDVVTTGATLNECARVLKDAGAKAVWGIVVARRG